MLNRKLISVALSECQVKIYYTAYYYTNDSSQQQYSLTVGSDDSRPEKSAIYSGITDDTQRPTAVQRLVAGLISICIRSLPYALSQNQCMMMCRV